MAAAFSKTLKATDVGSRLSWPAAKLHLLSPGDRHRRLPFVAVDASGNAWPFTCSVRARGPYLKPVLTGSSWLPFVRAKALAAGDLVLFYYHPTAGFRIRVRRRLTTIKLMGRYITCFGDEE